MSLLTPERVPVKVYRWDDADAPQLDKTAGCMATIFKACLVTGYGTKEGAGWTMPFEDASAGVKVLRPEIGPHTDFYLRLSADTGTEMAAQVYLNMTDANTGDLKLQCARPFKYAKAASSGKWVLIASSRSFWFFCEQRQNSKANQTGSYFYCGDLSAGGLGDRPVYLQHSGGGDNTGLFSSMFGIGAAKVYKHENFYLFGKLMLPSDGNSIVTTEILSMSDGFTVRSTTDVATDCCVIANNTVWLVPGLYSTFSGAKYNNFDSVEIVTEANALSAINFGASTSDNTNTYIETNSWRY